MNRVRKGELELQSKGMWDVPHPWLNIFIPRSQIQDLYHALTNIIANDTKDFVGPVLIYPLHRNKYVKLKFILQFILYTLSVRFLDQNL